MNARAQPSSALSSTGISISIPRRRSGAAAATSSETFAPSDVPPITASPQIELVHEAEHLLAEERHGVAPHVARPVGIAVTQQVEGDDPVSTLGQFFGERLVHVTVEQQPVDQDHGAAAGAPFVIDQPVAVDDQLVRRPPGHPAGVFQNRVRSSQFGRGVTG